MQVIDLSQYYNQALYTAHRLFERIQQSLESTSVMSDSERQHYQALQEGVRPWYAQCDDHWAAMLQTRLHTTTTELGIDFYCHLPHFEQTFVRGRYVPVEDFEHFTAQSDLLAVFNNLWPDIMGDPRLKFRTRCLLVPVYDYLTSLYYQGYRTGCCQKTVTGLAITLLNTDGRVFHLDLDVDALARISTVLFGSHPITSH